MSRPSLNERAVVTAQAGYFLVAGLWPFVHYRSFEALTGPKRDDWLAKTVSALVLGAAAALIAGLRHPRLSTETKALAVGTAAALGWSSTWYALTGRVRAVYLGDAFAEVVFIGGLLAVSRADADKRQSSGADASRAAAMGVIDV